MKHGCGTSAACPASEAHWTRIRVRLRCDAVSVASAVTGHGWTPDARDWTRPTKWTCMIGRGPTSLNHCFYLFKKCLPNTKAVLLRLLLAVSRKRTKRLHQCTLSPPFPRQVGLSPLFLFSSPPYFFFGFCGCRFWFLNNGSLFFLLPMLKKHYSLHLLSLSCYCFSIFPVVVLLAYCRNYE